MSGNVVMARNAEGPGAEYSTKSMQGKKKKATFECQSCTRKFATRSHLVRHSRVHTGERRYACDYPGCEMRCSRKDNLQQHYRTHLVVNPRRANAQSILTGPSHEFEPESATSTADIAHEFNSDKIMTSPTDLKPIISGNASISLDQAPSQPLQEVHSIAINGNNSVHIHPALGGALNNNDDTNGNGHGPERDWSISPPPPLSSAYDYWYAHGCLPQAARNPASVSGSGSSGATSPEISNALELAPGQIPRAYVDSPTTYYHHHPPPLGSSAANVNGGPYSSYDGDGNGQRPGFPLATATFPTAAEYHHAAAPSQSHPAHQRSHSHSFSIGGNSSGGYARLGYQSATTSPHLSHAHGNGIHHPGQAQARHHSYSADSYDGTTTSTTVAAASYANTNNRSIAVAPVVSGYQGHSQTPNPSNNSPTDRFSQSSSFHGHPSHSQSHSGSSHTFQPMSATPATRVPTRESDSRPVTRHGSISTTTTPQYPMPLYPSHPGMTYGVPVDMSPLQSGYAESPIQRHSMPVSVASSPRMSSQQSPSLVLPPIRYAEREMGSHPALGASTQTYGMMGGMGTHFSSGGTPWDRVNISDARALPPQAHLSNGGAGMTR